MSDLFVDMHQRRTAAALESSKQRKSRHGPAVNGKNKEGTLTPDTFYSSQHSTTTTNATTNDDYADADVGDELANVLSLKLRKPKNWRWELSTSRSCSNIALPRILLYDHKGQLLVDVDSQEEQCYSQPQTVITQKSTKESTGTQSRTRKRASKSASTNLAQSIKQALERQFSGLHIQEATPSPVPSYKNSVATTPSTEHASTLSSTIDFFTNELPDYKIQRRANSLKGVRFKVNEVEDANAVVNSNVKSTQNSFNLADLPTPPSTITTPTTPSNSSSSGPREKRRYRRSHSSGRSPATSESILERFSFNKGRFSSPEYVEEHEVQHAPRYFLRTSKAGTLVVQEESFSRYRRRRRPRNSSTENILSSQESGSKNSLKMSDCSAHDQLHESTVERTGDSLLNVTELGPQATRRRVFPVRRYRSDGNVLLQQEPISSDEHAESGREPAKARDSVIVPQQQRKYRSDRRQSRKELIIIDPENVIQPGADTMESR
ncbi:uncharacterized protein LOC105213929 [Zeugodacus cucurbitae]|uniref:Pantothenate synthetase n=1 Tax=Zeugodacus cucurbitae TaxID=28588 RepID=A0A0A1XK60_ZEUCU|nr:uncharacterized protein LOC105213929 [Zeugodacus cucurbitae]XP_054087465.1 uncharacterized protein LOC105213929 [Zeugodacus cucurbitae]XP_054087466.1 uncharacterized protein LOC105213929 [Zeugodacus cucurbitae]